MGLFEEPQFLLNGCDRTPVYQVLSWRNSFYPSVLFNLRPGTPLNNERGDVRGVFLFCFSLTRLDHFLDLNGAFLFFTNLWYRKCENSLISLLLYCFDFLFRGFLDLYNSFLWLLFCCVRVLFFFFYTVLIFSCLVCTFWFSFCISHCPPL